MSEQNDIFLWLSAGSSILPLVAGLWLRKRLTKPMALLLFYAAVVFLIELSSVILIKGNNENTILLFHFYTLVEFALLSSIFLLWQSNRTYRIAILSLLFLFTLLWVLEKQSVSATSFDSLVVTVEAVILVIFAVTSLIMLAFENTGSLFEKPRFWVSSGVLLYFAGNLIVFALGSKLLQQEDAALNYWRFHAALNFIANVFYMTGYLCLDRFRK